MSSAACVPTMSEGLHAAGVRYHVQMNKILNIVLDGSCNHHTCIHNLFMDTAAGLVGSCCSSADWAPIAFSHCCISGMIICSAFTTHVIGARSTVGRLRAAESLQDQSSNC